MLDARLRSSTAAFCFVPCVRSMAFHWRRSNTRRESSSVAGGVIATGADALLR